MRLPPGSPGLVDWGRAGPEHRYYLPGELVPRGELVPGSHLGEILRRGAVGQAQELHSGLPGGLRVVGAVVGQADLLASIGVHDDNLPRPVHV